MSMRNATNEIEMYLAGVSVRRVEDITEALWGTRVSSGTISNLNQKAYKHIETWRCRPLTSEYAYVYMDGVYLKRSWGDEIQNVSVLVAIGVDQNGYREILGAAEGMKEDYESWKTFLLAQGKRSERCPLYGVPQPASDPNPYKQHVGKSQPRN